MAGVEKLDTPSSVIAEWAQHLGCPVSALTGGTWQNLAHPKGQLLIAHLRVPQALATKVCSASGHRGLFATVVTRQDRPPVKWLLRSQEASDESYFRAAALEAKKRGVGLVYRQGGPADLGLNGVDPAVDSSSRKRGWEMFGSPPHWHQPDVFQFLKNEGWQDIQIRTRTRRRGQANAPPLINRLMMVFGNIPTRIILVTLPFPWKVLGRDILSQQNRCRLPGKSGRIPASSSLWLPLNWTGIPTKTKTLLLTLGVRRPTVLKDINKSASYPRMPISFFVGSSLAGISSTTQVRAIAPFGLWLESYPFNREKNLIIDF